MKKNTPVHWRAVLVLALFAGGCSTTPIKGPSADSNSASPFKRLVTHSVEDHRRHYDSKSLLRLLPALAVAGTLASTNADRWIRDIWQDDVRSEFSDDVAHMFLRVGDAGQNRWSVPVYALTMIATDYSGYEEKDSPVATWAERSLRANVLGGPQAWALTYVLGAHRPDVGTSGWNPWNDNDGVSGHSFYGAVPLLTAGRMTKNKAWRYSLYALSMLPAYARINDNQHYTSQAVMGWSIAWLATSTTAEKHDDDAFSVMPLLTPDGGYVMVNGEF